MNRISGGSVLQLILILYSSIYAPYRAVWGCLHEADFRTPVKRVDLFYNHQIRSCDKKSTLNIPQGPYIRPFEPLGVKLFLESCVSKGLSVICTPFSMLNPVLWLALESLIMDFHLSPIHFF